MAVSDAAPIVTRHLGHPDSHTLPRYLATGGYASLRKALAMGRAAVQEEVNKASLLGRGGAGFPAGQKWGMLRKAEPVYLVVNGDESEPATFKDHMLLEEDPHQIIEGTLITAFTIGASQAFIYVRGEFALGLERMTEALNQAYAHGAVGHNIFGSGWSIDVVIHPGAGAYICGDETGLLESLEGKRGFPRIKPPFFPAVYGLYQAPTVVNNVETMSNIPWIVEHGGDAFAALGANRSRGTRVFAVSGHVKRPGNYEVEMVKTTFRDLMYAPVYGGGIRDDRNLKAFIPGGASSYWFGPEQLDMALDQDEVGKAGTMLGSGSIVAMDETACMVRAAWRLTKFFYHESCGQCTPCREGSGWLEKIMYRIETGAGRETDIDLLLDACDNIAPGLTWPPRQTTICPLGPSIPSPIVSAIRMFRDEFLVHIKEGTCPFPRGAAVTDAIKIILDGREVGAEPGELIIAAAERAGVYIPRFCYHPRMKPVGMCRMCLVDVKGPRGFALTPACFIPVAEGQEIVTDSPAVKKAQDGVLEFLLVNHPLDCPVCDKGGECPLQDQTLAFGPGESRFVEEKRHWEKPIALSDLVLLDRERCIQCARCTRFADEIAGDPLIDFAERGDRIEVATFPDEPFASYFSGNTVQICPVGALTAKPYRFKARPWDLEQVESTCTTCAVGCRMAVQSSADRITRYLGIDSDPVNQSWLCDKGRFAFEAIMSDQRVAAPLVRKSGELVETSWGEALAAAANALQEVLRVHGPGALAVLGGARLANEDAYAWAKLAKAVLGTDNVDAQMGDGLPAEAVLGLPRATIDDACAAGAVILLGPDLKEELPVLHLRLRAAALDRGLRIVEVSPRRTGLSRHAASTLLYRPGEAAAVAAALVATTAPTTDAAGVPAADLAAAWEMLRGATDVVVVLGRPSLAEAGGLVADAAAILAAGHPGLRFLPALRRGNVHGALDMGLAPGILPGRVGLDAARDWFTTAWGSVPKATGLDCGGVLAAAAEGRIHGLVLLGADPVADFPDRQLATRGLAAAGFVVAVDAFLTESSRQADVVLPAAIFTERSGFTTNLEGRISRLGHKVSAPGVAWPDWMIAAELAARFGADLGFVDLPGIWAEIERLAPSHEGLTLERLGSRHAADGLLAPLRTAPAPHAGTGRPGGGEEATGAVASDTGSGSTQAVPAPIDPTADPGIGAVEAQGVPVMAADPTPPSAVTPPPRPDGPPPPPLGPPAPRRVEFPPLDAYSLRLVSGRTLWDTGIAVTRSPSLAHLARPLAVRVNPYDLDRLGVAGGEQVRMHAPNRTSVVDVVADGGVPRGSAALAFNTSDGGAGDFIDATAAVTDVRLEHL